LPYVRREQAAQSRKADDVDRSRYHAECAGQQPDTSELSAEEIGLTQPCVHSHREDIGSAFWLPGVYCAQRTLGVGPASGSERIVAHSGSVSNEI